MNIKILKKNALFKFKDYIDSKNLKLKDLKNLLLFILNTLHNELNESKNINHNITYGYAKYLNIYFNKYKVYFKNNYNSIIAKLFYLKYNSQTRCLNCNYISNNIQCNNILIFPLEEILKENEKIITIYDCFAYYQKQNYINLTCKNCKKEDRLSNSNMLMQCPKILIINITGEINNKKDIKFELEEKIELKKFIYDYKSGYNYELINLISIIENEHYIAFCKSLSNNKWYKYNDYLVNESMFKEIKNTGFPYLLFYSLIKNDN